MYQTLHNNSKQSFITNMPLQRNTQTDRQVQTDGQMTDRQTLYSEDILTHLTQLHIFLHTKLKADLGFMLLD